MSAEFNYERLSHVKVEKRGKKFILGGLENCFGLESGRYVSMRLIGARLAVLLMTIGAMARAEEVGPVTIYYSLRPSLIALGPDGQIDGVLGLPVRRIIEATELNVTWSAVPRLRAMHILQNTSQNDCTFGWYKTKERAKFALFSQPYYLDKPPVGLVRADFPVSQWSNLAELLAKPGLRLTLGVNVTYGDYVDGLLKQMPPGQIDLANLDNANTAKLILAGHTDMTIVPAEEIGQVFKDASLASGSLRVLFFTDLPQKDYRYIVCGLHTDPRVMDRINRAIHNLSLP